MPIVLYCWKCKSDVPMLVESEWAQLEPHMRDAFMTIIQFRESTGATLQDALSPSAGLRCRAFELHFQLTGVWECDPNKLQHHHTSFFGRPTTHCENHLNAQGWAGTGDTAF